MAQRIYIKMLLVFTLAVAVKADISLLAPPPSPTTHPSHSWNYFTMEYPPAIDIRPAENNFYHSVGSHQQFPNYQMNPHYGLNNFNGYKKPESIELANHAYTPYGNHPGYPWSGKPAGTSFQLPSRQPFIQALQEWPPAHRKIEKQYLPSGYVPLVSKIDPPKNYKLLTNHY